MMTAQPAPRRGRDTPQRTPRGRTHRRRIALGRTARRRRQLTRLVIVLAGILVTVALIFSALPPPPTAGPSQPAGTSSQPQP